MILATFTIMLSSVEHRWFSAASKELRRRVSYKITNYERRTIMCVCFFFIYLIAIGLVQLIISSSLITNIQFIILYDAQLLVMFGSNPKANLQLHRPSNAGEKRIPYTSCLFHTTFLFLVMKRTTQDIRKTICGMGYQTTQLTEDTITSTSLTEM